MTKTTNCFSAVTFSRREKSGTLPMGKSEFQNDAVSSLTLAINVTPR